jgi:hypothetical protein
MPLRRPAIHARLDASVAKIIPSAPHAMPTSSCGRITSAIPPVHPAITATPKQPHASRVSTTAGLAIQPASAYPATQLPIIGSGSAQQVAAFPCQVISMLLYQ